MADRVIYVSENEATRDFASVLEHVRAGAEVVIESASDKQPLAVMHLPVPAHRAIPECIALAKEHQEATGNSPVMDADFARDVEAAVASHREPREPSAWEQATNEVARLLLENRNGTEDWGEISHLQGMPCPKRVANEFLLCCLLDFQIPTNTAWDNGHRLVKHILGDPDDV